MAPDPLQPPGAAWHRPSWLQGEQQPQQPSRRSMIRHAASGVVTTMAVTTEGGGMEEETAEGVTGEGVVTD